MSVHPPHKMVTWLLGTAGHPCCSQSPAGGMYRQVGTGQHRLASWSREGSGLPWCLRRCPCLPQECGGGRRACGLIGGSVLWGCRQVPASRLQLAGGRAAPPWAAAMAAGGFGALTCRPPANPGSHLSPWSGGTVPGSAQDGDQEQECVSGSEKDLAARGLLARKRRTDEEASDPTSAAAQLHRLRGHLPPARCPSPR